MTAQARALSEVPVGQLRALSAGRYDRPTLQAMFSGRWACVYNTWSTTNEQYGASNGLWSDARGSGSATDQQHSHTAIYVETVVEGDEPEVLLEWWTSGGGVEAGIWDDVIIVERIAD